MFKKSFILVFAIILIICIFANAVFATDNVKNTVNGATNAVVDGINNLGSDVRNGIGAMENGIEDTFNMNTNNDNNNNTTAGNPMAGMTGDYTATRTTGEATTTDNNPYTLWIWLAVAVAAIVIIGLVWYYGTQSEHRSHHDE